MFMVDRFGLLTDGMPNLLPFQNKLVQKREHLQGWDTTNDVLSLLDVVRNVKPNILIGVSGSAGAVHGRDYPRDAQALPAANRDAALKPDFTGGSDAAEYPELDRWRGAGRHWQPVCPGHPEGKQYAIAQCNNSYIFPGIGLGVIASGASRVTDEMLMAASETLAKHSPLVNNGEGPVLPELKDIQTVSRAIAFAVGKVAQEQGVAVKTSAEALLQAISDNFWLPEYRNYRRTSI